MIIAVFPYQPAFCSQPVLVISACGMGYQFILDTSNTRSSSLVGVYTKLDPLSVMEMLLTGVANTLPFSSGVHPTSDGLQSPVQPCAHE